MLAVVVVVLALSDALCAAAPRVDIKVIARSRPKENAPTVVGPIPSREPVPAIQGPFADGIDLLPCVREEKLLEEEVAYVLDLCLLRNVTVKFEKAEPMEVEMEMMEDMAVNGHNVSAESEGSVSEKKEEQQVRTILGVFRGWQIDPITLNYNHMVYDDGDTCMDNDHYSMVVELIFSSDPKSEARLYGLEKNGMCAFKASLLVYVPEKDRVAEQGIHTPGVVDISDAKISLPVICGEMKCRYENITNKVRDLSDQIRDVQSKLMKGTLAASTAFTNITLEASKNTYASAQHILDKSLELFRDIEDMQRSLRNDFSEKENMA